MLYYNLNKISAWKKRGWFQCFQEILQGFLDISYQQYLSLPSLIVILGINLTFHCIQTDEVVVVGCNEVQYQCHEGDQCISKTALCDGTSDCPHGDDEHHCTTAASADHERGPAHTQHVSGNHEHVSGNLKQVSVQQEDVSTGVRTCTVTLSVCVLCWLLSMHLL